MSVCVCVWLPFVTDNTVPKQSSSACSCYPFKLITIRESVPIRCFRSTCAFDVCLCKLPRTRKTQPGRRAQSWDGRHGVAKNVRSASLILSINFFRKFRLRTSVVFFLLFCHGRSGTLEMFGRKKNTILIRTVRAYNSPLSDCAGPKRESEIILYGYTTSECSARVCVSIKWALVHVLIRGRGVVWTHAFFHLPLSLARSLAYTLFRPFASDSHAYSKLCPRYETGRTRGARYLLNFN